MDGNLLGMAVDRGKTYGGEKVHMYTLLPERVSPLFVIGLALLGCYCFGVLVWTGSLLVDQAGLIARNETSIERVKKTWRGRANPHDRGAFRNWLDFLFRATPSVVLELDQVESRCEAA